MAEPLTNVILVSILHLIRRDLTRNRRVPPRWVPPRRAPTCQRRRRPVGADQGRQHRPLSTADGAITTKITQAVAARTATATIRYTLHPKDTSRPWAAGRTTGGHHPVHGGQTSENPYNR
jgi:hypothetical protein